MKEYLFSAFLVCAFVSCGSLETISFDQLNPATLSFPEQVRNVAVLNNMPPASEARADRLVLGEMEGDGKASAEALAGALADSKYFNQVMICDSSFYMESASSFPKEMVDELSRNLDADMLVSLDRILIRKERHDVLYRGADMPWPVVRVKVTPVVSLYVTSREKPLNVLAKTDSLEWSVDDVVSDRDMLSEAASFAAHIVSRELVPYWTSAERVYFSGGSSVMRDAAVWVKELRWDKAYDLWKTLYDSSKPGNARTRAAFNLALACEMTGRMDEAGQWLDTAEKGAKTGSQEEAVCKFYGAQLKKRGSDFIRLNAQMGRF